jgi:hypothetical protein
MSNNAELSSFINDTKEQQAFWALQDTASEDWVVLDSINFEKTEVMPLWSTQALAKAHCIEEWANYTPAKITLADWLEFWVEDLLEDGVMVGINWQDDKDCLEIELAEFTQALAEIEKL